jgi:hypothetical protein
VKLIRVLVSRRSWYVGGVFGAVAFILHGVGLGNGPLIIVQPLVVTGIVIAVPLRAALDARRPSGEHVRWVAVTAAGIAVFVVASNPTTQGGHPRLVHVGPLLVVGMLGAAVIARIGMRAASARRRGIVLGAASGILLGLNAGTLKLTVLYADEGVLGICVVTTLIVVGITAFTLNQKTYQVAPLAVSMPALNVVVVIVAAVYGVLVFREVPAHGALALVSELLGIYLMGMGLARLAHRSGTPTSRRPARRSLRRRAPVRTREASA